MLEIDRSIEDKYLHEISHITAVIKKHKAVFNQLMWFRIGFFFSEILLFVAFVSVENPMLVRFIGFSLILPVFLFAWIVKKQSSISAAIQHAENLRWILQNEINIIHGEPNGYDSGSSFDAPEHPYTSDLDVFGPQSLFALVNRCATADGNRILANSFATVSTMNKMEEKQRAVQEVASHRDKTFEFRAFLLKHNPEHIKRLKERLATQLGNELQFTHNPLLRLYTKWLPFIILSTLLAAVFLHANGWYVIAGIAFLNVSITSFLSRRINRIYIGFSGSATVLNSFALAIRWIEEMNWKEILTTSLSNRKNPAGAKIKALSAIIQAFDLRLNVLVGGLLNLLLLWDVKCSIRLAEWQLAESHPVRQALDKIGDFEELVSLGTLVNNYQNWCFPDFKDNFCFEAEQLGHPLISERTRTYNDYAFTNSPTVDIITGSNMSGKSTFLRTIGISMVLAYAGAPVPARALRLSVFNIFSYMRIKDSLHENTSTFKAEIDRLKMILQQISTDSNALLLVDEMLRGTNSKDKFLGSMAFIKRMITLHCPALFATHDLQLSKLEDDNPGKVRNFHFDIQIDENDMVFDYLLKNGPCTTFNASILLKQIGL